MSLDFSLIHENGNELFSANITHNLNLMAHQADLYQVLWRPEELGYTRASQCVPELKEGLAWLIENKEYAETLNAPNGWGTYKHFVPFVLEVLMACQENPNAIISVCR